MTLKVKIYPGSISLFLIWLQNSKMCLASNKIELQETDYLASKLSYEECFQLYNLLDHRHVNRAETFKYVYKTNRAIPCINLLATWLTDPDESSYYKTVDKIALKLSKIGRKDLALWLDSNSNFPKDKTELSHVSEVKKLEMNNKQIIYQNVTEDERRQRSTCPSEDLGRMQIFWKIFFTSLIILIFLLLCMCCYRCIYEKLRCICSRSEFKPNNDKENEEKRCLCTDQCKISPDDCCTNKKEFYFTKFMSKFKRYFKNCDDRKREKSRYKNFQKLKKKLQKMYFDQRKEVKINKQEENILNSLTEEERNELGKMIREVKFLLESDEESERLLLSAKRQGSFIIDMKNLRHPKIQRCYSSQEIKTIKKWRSKDKLSSSLSEEMFFCTVETKKSGNESTRSDYEKVISKDNFKKSIENRKNSRDYFTEDESPDYTGRKGNSISKTRELNVKSEFVKCYSVSDSDKNNSSPVTWERNQRRASESEGESSLSTLEATDSSRFHSENQFDNFSSPIITENKKEVQSDIEGRKKSSINIIRTGSATELGSKKSNSESRLRFRIQNINKRNSEQNRDFSEYNKNKEMHNGKKKINTNFSRTTLDSNLSWSFTPCYDKRNPRKSNDNLSSLRNSDHGDTESQMELRDTYDELGLLFSQYMKQQSCPCYRKYCLLRRHLRQSIHDQSQCRAKNIYCRYCPYDQAPSCSSGNICRDTYDEFNLMRSTPEERQKIRQAVYARRKEFLDQPCVLPERQIFQMCSG